MEQPIAMAIRSSSTTSSSSRSIQGRRTPGGHGGAQREQRRGGRRGQRRQAAAEAGHLDIGSQDEEDGCDRGRDHDPIGLAARVGGLLGQVRPGLEPGEQQHPVHRAQADPGPAAAADAGLNGWRLLAQPSRTMTMTKKTGTTTWRPGPGRAGRGSRSGPRSTGAATARWPPASRPSPAAGPPRTRGDRALQVAADEQQQPGQQDDHPAVVEPARRGPDPLAQAAGHVVVQRPGRVDLPGVAGHDPAEREDADRGDQHRQRRRRPRRPCRTR